MEGEGSQVPGERVILAVGIMGVEILWEYTVCCGTGCRFFSLT